VRGACAHRQPPAILIVTRPPGRVFFCAPAFDAAAHREDNMRSDLLSDCASCAALCCVATSFSRSEEFAYDKAAGQACAHVARDFSCAIHAERAVRGFSGCTIYDCHGAGQRATRSFSCADRDAAFLALRVVHELLWLLDGAARLCPASEPALAHDLAVALEQLDEIAADPRIVDVDVRALRRSVPSLLRRVGAARGGRRGALPIVVE
jgi:hypothetical protein